MTELFEGDLRETGRKSSKGNQLKWENDGIWFKADYLGYEGMAECVVSSLLHGSSLDPDEYVIYEPEEISYKKQIFTGCRSRDFAGGWQNITLERLFKNQYGTGLNQGIHRIEDHTERLKFLVEQVERTTGIRDFGPYMAKLFTIDAVFLNEDRHTHNISILMNGKGEYRLCPVYDNGAALLSDMTLDYPEGCDIYAEIGNAKPKTICDSFEEQLDIAENLYGRHMSFSFTAEDIRDALRTLTIYDERIRERVELILLEQRRKYRYLFSEKK